MAFVKNLVAGPDKNNFQATAASNDVQRNIGNIAAGNQALSPERRNLNGDIGTGLSQQQAGFGGLQGVAGQQQSFADVLRSQALGTGGPLNTIYQNNLAQANANVAGTLASNKGITPALAARLAAQNQGANALQQGNFRAQGQLAAQQAYGQQQQAQAQTAAQMAAAGQNLYGNAGQQQAAQNANLLGLTQLSTQGALANQNAEMQAQQINAGVAQGNVDASNAAAGQILSTAGAVAGGIFGGPAGAAAGSALGHAAAGGKAHGGLIEAPQHKTFAQMVAHHLLEDDRQHFAKGGAVKMTQSDVRPIDKVDIGKALEEGTTGVNVGSRPGLDTLQGRPEGKAYGGVMHMYDAGGGVPGEAMHPGDDGRNDVVPALLSPGEIVLPRSVAYDPEKSRRFVEHIRSQTPAQYGDIKRRR